MIMEMVFKRGAIIGCAIAVIKSVNGILRTLLDFMLLGSVVLALFISQMPITIRIYQERLLMLQMALDPLREADQEFQPNTVSLSMN